MIGAAAFFNGQPADWHTVTAQPDLSVEVLTPSSPGHYSSIFKDRP